MPLPFSGLLRYALPFLNMKYDGFDLISFKIFSVSLLNKILIKHPKLLIYNYKLINLVMALIRSYVLYKT